MSERHHVGKEAKLPWIRVETLLLELI
jgi:hypothetical protein